MRRALRQSERGAVASEYGIILALVALALIAAVLTFRTELVAAFDNTTDEIRDQVNN